MGLRHKNPARHRLLAPPEGPASLASACASAADEPSRAPAGVTQPIAREERHSRIARAAYGHAERAGFTLDPLHAWLAAEREIDARLAPGT